MFKKEPEGYRKLLAYQKALGLQQQTNELVRFLPKTKTFLDLADQMARSGRSGSKNIVEGWKRTTTKEYFTFLGFSVGAIQELMEDAADVITGAYPELMGIREIMGSAVAKAMADKGKVEKGVRGLMTREELDNLKFYPLDTTLPPIVQLCLKAKEVGYLIYRLQQSLDLKMDNDGTKPLNHRLKEKFQREEEADKFMEELYKERGLVRLPNGQYITREKGGEGVKGD